MTSKKCQFTLAVISEFYKCPPYGQMNRITTLVIDKYKYLTLCEIITNANKSIMAGIRRICSHILFTISEMVGWSLVVLGLNATLTAKVISWRSCVSWLSHTSTNTTFLSKASDCFSQMLLRR